MRENAPRLRHLDIFLGLLSCSERFAGRRSKSKFKRQQFLRRAHRISHNTCDVVVANHDRGFRCRDRCNGAAHAEAAASEPEAQTRTKRGSCQYCLQAITHRIISRLMRGWQVALLKDQLHRAIKASHSIEVSASSPCSGLVMQCARVAVARIVPCDTSCTAPKYNCHESG